MRTNLMLMLDDERGETATAAARFLIQVLGDEGARARVVELASHHRSLGHRAVMRDLAERLGLSDRIDRLASYRLDLEQGATCPDRQRAVAKLRPGRSSGGGGAEEGLARRSTPACGTTRLMQSATSMPGERRWSARVISSTHLDGCQYWY